MINRGWKILFAISGVVVLMGSFDSPVLLPYPLFVLAYFRGWHLPMKGTPAMRLLVSTLICTLTLEFSAWLNEYIKNTPQPALFHPQLIPDLIMGLGLYTGWWLTWWLILRRYHFTASQVFITTGLYGFLIEQQGKVFLAGLQSLPVGTILWLFVFTVYGATMALAFWLVREDFTATNDHWTKYIFAWLGLFFFSILTSLIWGAILQVLHFTPLKKLPIRDYPLW